MMHTSQLTKLLPRSAVLSALTCALTFSLWGCEESEVGSDAGAPDAGQTPDDTTPPPAAGCTREALKMTMDRYFAALAAHDPALAPLAPNAKYTENGKQVALGQGLWTTAGAVKFTRTAFDTESCSSASEAVVPDGATDRVYGLRLASPGGKITEIETLIIHEDDYFTPPDPQGLIGTRSDDWESVLPAAQRSTRAQLRQIVDRYFNLFPNGACNFAPDCVRFENGLSILQCDFLLSCDMNADPGASAAGMQTRLAVIDPEAGIAVGYTMFAGAYSDFHMFKVRDGQVHGVHAVLAAADGSGWD
jgi:hypothetical protein